MSKEIVAIFEYLEREKGIKRDVIVKAIEDSLQAAARKNIAGASNVTVTINPKTGDIDVYSEKEISEVVEVPAQEISLEAAKELDPDCEIGQFIDVLVTPKNFGRIAAQKARQIIAQKLKTAERDVIYDEYRHRNMEVVSGSVKRFIGGASCIVDLGKVEALLPMRNYPKTERYEVGDKVMALLLEVQDTEGGGAEVILTRSHPEFVRQLLIQEVPEVSDGTVVIDKIEREAGYRTKLTVRSMDPKVDPVGACVGVRGSRIKNVVSELNNEKIDIIPYSDDPIELLQNALAPIEIRKILVNEEERVISIVCDDEDYPAVIGKKGMNIRLNSRLVGYELEIQKMTEHTRTMAIERLELASSEDASLDEPLSEVPGISTLIVEQLVADGYGTPRQVLMASPEALSEVPGISLELADQILERVRKQRT